MSIRFHCSELIKRDRGLTFDDVLIVPSKSEIKSRRVPQLETHVTKRLGLKIPIISSNMDTITEGDMAIAMAEQIESAYMLKPVKGSKPTFGFGAVLSAS